MARIFLLSLILVSQLSFALEIYQSRASEKAWTFVYAQDGRWLTETLTIDKSGWPQLTSTKQSAQRPVLPLDKNKRLKQAPFQEVELKNQNGLTLWEIRDQWSWQWELKFSQWVKSELHSGWWKENNIATDCADVIYSARWIFARNNGLPMANHLISGHIFSHQSVKPEWAELPSAPEWQNDQRFLAALEYLLTKAFTHTLWQDSYPVAINKTTILPGGYHLQIDAETGHTQFLYQVGTDAESVPVLTLNSTVPRELRDMMEWVFLVYSSDRDGSALMRMRWPLAEDGKLGLVSKEQMPHFSLEQFSPDFIGGSRSYFWQEVFHRLNPNSSIDQIGLRTVQQMSAQFKARIPVVNEGYRICSTTPCLPGTPDYEAWSTPSRDKRITETIQVFDSISPMISTWSPITAVLLAPLLNMNGRNYNAYDFMSVWRANQFSSDPNDRPQVRWGLDDY